ncbi:Nif11-like leader peptide family natural product precursor [Synechococcus sp. UW179A]|uniref:Nif11-like leader peptide family natural product precursor n=1 Tax=Synechococcus sp. UW179A TaxID=2575510 RepID=UPI000E0F0395|nr:Nif11-like leader peptide family natural product precursor [Synechococcus sp. UW179A]
MSEEQLKAFLEKVKADTSLKEKLKAEGADLVAIAKDAGFMISVDDLKKAKSELSKVELEGIAGGFYDPPGGCRMGQTIDRI